MNFIAFVYNHAETFIEGIGILATVFIFISFTQTDNRKIRMINSIGSLLFVIYGVAISALSVYLMNGAVLLLNIYKLVTYSDEVEYKKVRTAGTQDGLDVPDIKEIKVVKK